MKSLLLPPTPRLPGRPRRFDMDSALDQAIVVFSERGYSGASIADLGKAMGLTAGSLYKAFADKQAIFVAAFERYAALRLEKLDQALATAPTGRERLRQVFAQYVASSSGAEGRRGCLIVHSATELSTAEPAAQRVAQALAANETRLLTLLQQGQADGSIRLDLDAAAVARLLLCVLQGMRVVGKTGRTQPEMAALVGQVMRLLN